MIIGLLCIVQSPKLLFHILDVSRHCRKSELRINMTVWYMHCLLVEKMIVASKNPYLPLCLYTFPFPFMWCKVARQAFHLFCSFKYLVVRPVVIIPDFISQLEQEIKQIKRKHGNGLASVWPASIY